MTHQESNLQPFKMKDIVDGLLWSLLYSPHLYSDLLHTTQGTCCQHQSVNIKINLVKGPSEEGCEC